RSGGACARDEARAGVRRRTLPAMGLEPARGVGAHARVPARPDPALFGAGRAHQLRPPGDPALLAPDAEEARMDGVRHVSVAGAPARPRLRVLLSAYACEPSKGSEPGIGWNWAL